MPFFSSLLSPKNFYVFFGSLKNNDQYPDKFPCVGKGIFAGSGNVFSVNICVISYPAHELESNIGILMKGVHVVQIARGFCEVVLTTTS